MNFNIPTGLIAKSVVALLALIASADCYPTYQTYIPNGVNVPDPCRSVTHTLWPGVGHEHSAGGGIRNPFGVDFAASQHNWTAVCPLDSDGDGRTNGQELGDPDCTWKIPMSSPPAINLTHPGICEPVDSAACSVKNSWLNCTPAFSCPAIESPDVVNLTLRMPPTSIPPQTTTYMCYGFVLPNDTDYHVIAITPVINTSQVLHHMLLYVCKNYPGDDLVFNEPEDCNMGIANCFQLIGLWGVGATGQCLNNQFGFRIGATGYKYAILQLHWNNPSHASGYVDSSGMTLYYTTNLRPNDGGIMMVGQTSLTIPPGLSSISFQATCSEHCTSVINGSLNMASAVLHMHMLGQSGDILLYRNGALISTLVDVQQYYYNDPPIVSFSTPIQLQPGDEIRLDCTYQSTHTNVTTYYGESTSDEMCYGFISYYPANDNFTYCGQWRSLDMCSNAVMPCDLSALEILGPAMVVVCNHTSNCSSICRLIMMAAAETGCLSGDIGQYLLGVYPQGVSFIFDLLNLCGISTSTSTTPIATAAATTTTSTITTSTNTTTTTTMKSGGLSAKKMSAESSCAIFSVITILATLLAS